MAGLLDVYESMINAQAGTEKLAEAQVQTETEVDARMEVLEKYASVADELLEEEFGNDYDKEDVVKLAQLLINHDTEVYEQMEKVAELHEAGIIMGKAFKAELARP